MSALPDETHIKTQMTHALANHFRANPVITVDDVDYTASLSSDAIVVLTNPDGEEVGYYLLAVATQEVTHPHFTEEEEPEWVQGTWADVRVGDFIQDPDDQAWEVTAIEDDVFTICREDQQYGYSPIPGDAITYHRRCLQPVGADSMD